MNILDQAKKLWENRIVKTLAVTALGGAFGVIAPMAIAGTLVLNTATIHSAVVGAITAVGALYVKTPSAPATSPVPTEQPTQFEEKK